MSTDFERFHAMQQMVHKEEAEAQEARLIEDGTYQAVVDSYEPISPERLPSADVVGYRVTFKVDQQGVEKRNWVSLYFSPVMNNNGKLHLNSKLGTQLATALNMTAEDTIETVLERGKFTPVMQRIVRKPATNGYKAGNTTWAISPVK
jgi:hypothetical protein